MSGVWSAGRAQFQCRDGERMKRLNLRLTCESNWPHLRWAGQYAKMRSGMKFLVSIYQDEDGAYIAECPSIPGCVSQGQTEAEAESNITDAIRECAWSARAE